MSNFRSIICLLKSAEFLHVAFSLIKEHHLLFFRLLDYFSFPTFYFAFLSLICYFGLLFLKTKCKLAGKKTERHSLTKLEATAIIEALLSKTKKQPKILHV